MADILPSTPDIGDAEERDPRVIGVDGDDADDVLSALSSATARRLLSELHADPGPASDVADRADTSLQNAQYHLKRLREAGLVEVAGTAYSEKGREMDVYAPADRALVLVAGREEDTTGLKGTLERLLGAVGAVTVGAAAVEQALGGPFALGVGAPGGATTTGSDGGAGGEGVSIQDVETTAEVGRSTVTAARETAADLGADTVAGQATTTPTLLDTLAASPGALFLLGGLVTLALVGAYLYARR
ncbi:ArsR/SmtB family transcription factor [Candidatus Halobonum tyrrellensis]|uniref:Transcriptional regulator n=1 Tax=Candidatus Halobonum tyrrellensis G22 TaxID=1324957 RepID=V4GU54_9EURY|nr:winged helix-turn-helix domain-containing protein [Candidatus Halobonum tyrrellensis]ESP88661.1 transcriptional regulator [Candidatus Halobonum tyrrellensis G22]